MTTTADTSSSAFTTAIDSLSTSVSDATSSVTGTLKGSTFTFSLAGGGEIFNVNIPQIQTINNLWKELNPPKVPTGTQLYGIGSSTISPLARGVINNSAISKNNSNLFHNCGFLNDIGLTGLAGSITGAVSSITSLINTIKYPKRYAAGSVIRISIAFLNQAANAIKNLLFKVFDFCPPFVAQLFSEARYYLGIITKYAKLAAKMIREAESLLSITTNLNQIVSLIKKMPAQILRVLKGCLNTFLGSVSQISTALQSIPNATKQASASNSFTQLNQNIKTTTDKVAAAAASSQSSSVATAQSGVTTPTGSTAGVISDTTINLISDAVTNATTGTTTDTATALSTHLAETYGTKETVQSSATAAVAFEQTIPVVPSTPYSQSSNSQA